MIEENFETESLEALAERIVQYANEADERTIEAALLIRMARDRVNRGKAGNTTWYEWAPKNIGLSTTRLRELQRIADAPDPKKELERLRKCARKRAEKHRQKQKAKQATPLRSGGDETVKSPAEPEEDRQSPSESGSERGEGHVEERKDEPPLRNGGEDAGAKTAEVPNCRGRLIRWAEDAPLEQIERAWALIQGLEPAAPASDPEDPTASVAA